MPTPNNTGTTPPRSTHKLGPAQQPRAQPAARPTPSGGKSNKPQKATAAMATDIPPAVASVTPAIHEEYVTPKTDDEDDIDDLCERAEKYDLLENEKTDDDKGLLYPICIGDILQNRYRVVHRLGYGGASTVWLASDSKSAKAVALKVMVAGDHGRVGETEYTMQNLIKRDTTDQSHFLLFDDTFFLEANGRYHRVLVLPLAGPSLKSNISMIPMRNRLSGAKQLLEALRSLHQAGLVHSDINLGNILWGVKPEFAQKLASDPSYHARASTPKVRHKVDWKRQGKPVYGHRLLPLKFPPESISDKVYLSDFGLTHRVGTPVGYKLQGVLKFISPERFHDADPSPASDMWSFMVVFVHLYLEMTAFKNVEPFMPEMPESILSNIVERLGLLPAEWAAVGAEKHNPGSWYNAPKQSEEVSRKKVPFGDNLAKFRDYLAGIENKDRTKGNEPSANELLVEINQRKQADRHASAVISKVFQMRPEKRLTASQLLEDKDWKALMRIYEV